MDDVAWERAIEEAEETLAKMTSTEGLNSWSAAVEENLPDIAAAYSQFALQVAAGHFISLGAGAVLTAAGLASFPVAVVAVPVTVVAAFYHKRKSTK